MGYINADTPKGGDEKVKFTEVPYDPRGCLYHLGVAPGQVHRRLLIVGHQGRADAIAQHLDNDPAPLCVTSGRQYRTYSGSYKGVPVSVMAVGMGVAQVEFAVREVADLLGTSFVVVRLGTCGLINPTLKPGTFVVASKGSIYCQRNYSYWDGEEKEKNTEDPYLFSPVVCGDDEVHEELFKQIKNVGLDAFHGLNASSESFYSSQGRFMLEFQDKNKTVLPHMQQMGIDSLEMETHQVFHLARWSTPLNGDDKQRRVRAGSVCLGLWNRSEESHGTLREADVHDREKKAGTACLEALISLTL